MWTQSERPGSQKGTHNQGTKLQTWLNSKVWGENLQQVINPQNSKHWHWTLRSAVITPAHGLCITCVHLIRCLCRLISEAPKEEVFTYLMRTLPVLALITAFFWLYYVGTRAQQNSQGTIKHKAPVTAKQFYCIILNNDRLIVIFQLLLEINQLQVKNKSKTKKRKKEMEEQ